MKNRQSSDPGMFRAAILKASGQPHYLQEERKKKASLNSSVFSSVMLGYGNHLILSWKLLPSLLGHIVGFPVL